ncbi:MAG: hypothetical protein QM528_02180 [Phycisphaerales bacterium]|nr:hypothetical protein [Phycisphaerales bacterium]
MQLVDQFKNRTTGGCCWAEYSVSACTTCAIGSLCPTDSNAVYDSSLCTTSDTATCPF